MSAANGTWIDVHSHFLPKMDDGSRSAEESLNMLRECVRQNVGTMIATPHFYAEQNTPEVFLRRRMEAQERLLQAAELSGQAVELPRIFCGAEVAYFTGMGNYEELSALCVEGTNVLLLEMPFCRWSDAVRQEISRLKDHLHLRVVIAHIERYIDEQPSGTLDELIDEGFLIQSNAEPFLHWSSRGKALRRLKAGQIHLLGSDCHNMAARAPNLGPAVEVIEAKCGPGTAAHLCENAHALFADAKSIT